MPKPLQLPSHEIAQNTILGAMMLDPVALADGCSSLQPQDFPSEAEQVTFRCMAQMHAAGRHVDLLTLAEAIRASGLMGKLPGEELFLADLGKLIPRNADLRSYVQLVKDRGLARMAILALHRASEQLMSQMQPASKTIDGLVRQLTEQRPDESKHISQFLPEALAMLEPEGYTTLRTGIDELDAMTHGGARTGELWILGGSPSSGKSALARQIERAAIAQNFPVHAFSVEVKGAQWTQFHMANLAQVEQWKLRQPELLSVSDKDKLIGAAARIEHWPHTLDDAGGMHIDTLLSKARLSAMRRGTRVLTIDYLQLLDSDKRETRDALGDIAKRLKIFAKENDCLVIALSQLNRGDQNEEPHMSRLKDSSWLEQAGDVILLSHRPKDKDTARFSGEDRLIIGKQRNGTVGALNMHLETNTLCWRSRAA